MKKTFKTSRYFFISFFAMFTLTTFVFVCYLFYTYHSIKKKEIYSQEEYLKNFTSKINSTFTTFDNVATQIAMLPSVNQLLYETESKSLTNFIKLRDDLEVFGNSNIYHSIALYFGASNTVYTTFGGLYRLNEFFDQDFIKELLFDQSNNYGFYPSRTINHPFTSPTSHNVFSIFRKTPLFGNMNGYLVINLHSDSFSQLIASHLPASLTHAGLVKNGILLFSSDPVIETVVINNLATKENQIFTINNEKYILQQITLQSYDFQTVALLPYSLINSQFLGAIRNSFFIYCLILFGELLISFFFTILLSRPINLMITKIQAKTPVKENISVLKGFEGLSQALDDLFIHADNITDKFENNLPVLKESILLDLLWNNHVSPLKPNKVDLSSYGIDFTFPYFYVFIAYTEEINQVKTFTIKDQIRIYMQENIMSLFAPLGNTYSIFLETNKLVFILNTDMDIYTDLIQHEQINNILTQLHHLMKEELSIHVAFSFGTKENSYSEIHLSYHSANNNLIYASMFNDEFAVFCESHEKSPIIKRLPLGQLINYIIDKNHDGMIDYISTSSQWYQQKHLTNSQIKQLLISFTSSIYIELWEKGIDVSPNDLTFTLSKINNMTDFSNVWDFLNEAVQNISLSIGISENIQENKNVATAIDFIHTNYRKDISVAEIAEQVGLNHIYLNRIFKLSTGKTLSEYLNIYRIEQSKDMLCNTNHSVAEISKLLGYNDVRSYIRFFKKFVGVTPGDYRN